MLNSIFELKLFQRKRNVKLNVKNRVTRNHIMGRVAGNREKIGEARYRCFNVVCTSYA